MIEVDPRSPGAVPALVRTVLRPLRPWLAASGALAGLAAGASVASGTGLWIHATAVLLLHLVLGLLGSFVVHELGHVVALRWWAPGVERIRLDASWTRVSITPVGVLTSGQAIASALAGPGLCVLVGTVIALASPLWGIQVWYLLHAVFVLPCFGDGRAILTVLRRSGSAHHSVSPSS
ncbi:MAG: hypothetical protein Q4G34_06945 [Micrococcus sp.]|nr:hypothetical protein [Micrococcus sp.]